MIRVFIADDHEIVRDGLKRIISECSDMELVGEAVNGDEVITWCRSGEVDVLVLDVTMPGPGYLVLIEKLKRIKPTLRILILSMHLEDHYARRALAAGAAGYLTKTLSSKELADAIRRVYTGKIYITMEFAEKLAVGLTPEHSQKPHESLSDREYHIFCMLGEGKRVSEIAKDISLSPKTVSTYRSRVYKKMQFKNHAELIRYAIENGLID